MNVVNVTLGCNGNIFLGRRGENEVTQVVVDFSSWVEEFGTGAITLYAMRSADTQAYPVSLTIDGTTATWLVSNTDTAYVGNGKAEYVYQVNGLVAKTAVFYTVTGSDIGEPSETPPDPYTSWIETLTELAGTTQINAQAAASSATDAEIAQAAAETAEDNAAESALKSEGFAIGEQNGTAVSSDSPYYENNAEWMKEQAAAYAFQSDGFAGQSAAWATGDYSGDPSSPVPDIPQTNNNAYYYAMLAQQGAEASGFAWFDVNDQDGNMYVTITPSLAEDVSFSINENTGELVISYV